MRVCSIGNDGRLWLVCSMLLLLLYELEDASEVYGAEIGMELDALVLLVGRASTPGIGISQLPTCSPVSPMKFSVVGWRAIHE